MKEVYICEKCGKMFDGKNAYSECYDCENSHSDIDVFNDYVPELKKRSKWKTGCRMPSVAVLKCEGRLIYDKESDNYEEAAPLFGFYELKRILAPSEAEQIINEQNERKQKEREQYEAYCREREEREAAKAQASSTEAQQDAVVETA